MRVRGLLSDQIGELWTNNMTEWKVKGLRYAKITKTETHFTSLKLSKAERMMSCPPLTRHTAANNSSTRALVLWHEQCKIWKQVDWQHVIHMMALLSPGIPAVETQCDLIHTAWMTHHKVKTRLRELQYAIFSRKCDTLNEEWDWAEEQRRCQLLLEHIFDDRLFLHCKESSRAETLPGSSW